MESANVRIVAVWGMGGIGKTTLVAELYNLIHHKFESCCFLLNIGQTSQQNGLVALQKQLLSDILGTGTHNIRNFRQGIEVIKRRALSRKGTEAVKGLLLNTTDVQVNAKPFEKMDRLWYHESVLGIQRDSMGTEEVEDCLLNLNDPEHVQVNAKAFEKMNNLWLLHLDYFHQTADFEHASRRLLWLSWKGFPLECLPWNLSMEKLIYLDLRCSSLKKVWNGYKGVNSIGFSLTSIQAFGCLKELKMAFCSLSYLPDEIRNLISLQTLDLRGNDIISFPDCICDLKSLKDLVLSSNDVSCLPCEIGRLTSLVCLHLSECNLSHLPSEIGNLVSLNELWLDGNNICTLPDSISNLHSLRFLYLHKCTKLQSLPKLQALNVYAEDCASLESLPLELDQLGQYMFCADCNKLVENDFANRLLKQLHRSKGLAELEECVVIVVPTVSDVPIWFPYQGKGSILSFVVPPLLKKKMLGSVICIFLREGDEVEIEIWHKPASVVKYWGVDFIYEVDENITKRNENQEALIQYTPTLHKNVSHPKDFSLANK
ncbi:hypothetical protein Vadar_023389 [Vaccinium darrowii]|uniref:Uncharacterized protein n=1 Tax=Vaccinium darrowii TaxID=229202 RepID=A0ACB7YNW0_9ERIC|nr:hypothetical protein Vadar_023389 [Vaccinium darrowii]